MAHELRTPLQAVYAGTSGIKNYIPSLLETYEIAKAAKLDIPPLNTFVFKSVMRCLTAIESSIHYAFSFIDMVLMNVKAFLELIITLFLSVLLLMPLMRLFSGILSKATKKHGLHRPKRWV